MSTRPTGDAPALAGALRATGLPCDVEPRAALALLSTRVEHAARLASPEERGVVLALARQYGFTHIAVELSADAAGADAAGADAAGADAAGADAAGADAAGTGAPVLRD